MTQKKKKNMKKENKTHKFCNPVVVSVQYCYKLLINTIKNKNKNKFSI